MAFKTFAPGVLTSSDVNTFLMRQAVITCTSTTRPASPNEGMTIYETDTDLYLTYTGAAWLELSRFIAPNYLSFTPTWTRLTLGNATTNVGRFTVIGKTVHIRARLVFGSTTSITGDGPQLDYPSGFTRGGSEPIAQDSLARLVDESTAFGFTGIANVGTTGLVLGRVDASTTTAYNGIVNATSPFTWTTSDEIRLSATYGIG
jgi:hypothetical protein